MSSDGPYHNGSVLLADSGELTRRQERTYHLATRVRIVNDVPCTDSSRRPLNNSRWECEKGGYISEMNVNKQKRVDNGLT